jgi:dephospho-CoA kinase
VSTHKQESLRIGLTGGIASGKSTVADLFAELGVPVIDTDIIAREVVAADTPGLAALVDAFGGDILRSDGSLDRVGLRNRVFGNSGEKARLDAILHPLIRAATLEQSAAADGAFAYQIIVVPLLLESGFDELVDRILVVDCPVELQRRRLMERDGDTREAADAIISAQASREERLAAADDVIENTGDISYLESAIRKLHDSYLRQAAMRAGNV